jgi:NTE family protein
MPMEPDVEANVHPVRFLPQDPSPRTVRQGTALCLSGGGYRAMIFHLGALWRLNEAGYLGLLKRISSVSGGSITSGMLGLRWKQLQFSNGIASNYEELVVRPVMRFAESTIDVGSIIGGILFPRKSIADEIAGSYREHLFGNATLQDLPADDEGPRFVINATNVQTGVLWRFSRPYMGDYRVGLIRNPNLELAEAVGASSAFPPFLSPAELKLDPKSFEPDPKADLQKAPFTSDVILTDGGVYDNLGLETAWKKYETILVSDAGGIAGDEPKPKRDWVEHAYRAVNIIDNQVGSLRKRQVIASYELGLRKGAYWGIRTDITHYSLPDSLPCPYQETIALANIATRLKALDRQVRERLVNWGYAVCDAALRKHVDPNIPPPQGFPYPDPGVGTARASGH